MFLWSVDFSIPGIQFRECSNGVENRGVYCPEWSNISCYIVGDGKQHGMVFKSFSCGTLVSRTWKVYYLVHGGLRSMKQGVQKVCTYILDDKSCLEQITRRLELKQWISKWWFTLVSESLLSGWDWDQIVECGRHRSLSGWRWCTERNRRNSFR